MTDKLDIIIAQNAIIIDKLNRVESNTADAKPVIVDRPIDTARITDLKVAANPIGFLEAERRTTVTGGDHAKSVVETVIALLTKASEQFTVVSEEHVNLARVDGVKTKRWFLRGK